MSGFMKTDGVKELAPQLGFFTRQRPWFYVTSFQKDLYNALIHS